MAPGPMLFATIESSLKTGWTAGPKVVFGHALIEVFTCALIIAGMTAVVNDSVIRGISLMGGVALCIFGGLMLKERKNATLNSKSGFTITNPALSGIITSAYNPYFWFW